MHNIICYGQVFVRPSSKLSNKKNEPQARVFEFFVIIFSYGTLL